jgi:hypothetical protein
MPDIVRVAFLFNTGRSFPVSSGFSHRISSEFEMTLARPWLPATLSLATFTSSFVGLGICISDLMILRHVFSFMLISFNYGFVV